MPRVAKLLLTLGLVLGLAAWGVRRCDPSRTVPLAPDHGAGLVDSRTVVGLDSGLQRPGSDVARHDVLQTGADPRVDLRAGRLVRGSITDPGGTPIAQASILIESGRSDVRSGTTHPPLDAEYFALDSARRSLCASAASDARGEFAISGVRSGTSRLCVRAEGYGALDRDVLIDLASEQDLGRIVLVPGAGVTGRVVDPTGRPVAGAGIFRLDGRPPRGGGLGILSPQEIEGRSRTRARLASTDADGGFALHSLPLGPWKLLVESDEFPAKVVSGASEAFGPEQRIVVQLEPGLDISGRVLAHAELGYLALEVAVHDAEVPGKGSTYFQSVPCEADGRFRLSRLAPPVREVALLLVSIHGDGPYTRELLDAFDVLILKTPHVPLDGEEVSAIRDWVEEGGGLFAIGDHTDLGGMGTYLNQVVEPFGIAFGFDSTGSTSNGSFETWTDPWISEHPVSAGLSPFGVMSGCSLSLSGSAQPVLTLRQSWAMDGDYSQSSNFGRLAATATRAHGMLAVAAAAWPGRGRVLAFGDSTVFSSFAYYLDSHAEFAARSVAWLNCRSSGSAWIRGSAAVLGILASYLCWRRGGGRRPIACAGVIAVGFLLGARTVDVVTSSSLLVPAPASSPGTVGFVTEGGFAWLPPAIGGRAETPRGGDFTTFAQLPQRLGLETRVVSRQAPELADLRQLVVVNPDVEHGQAEADESRVLAVRRWVEDGGTLIVLQRREHAAHEHDRASIYLDGIALQPVTAHGDELQVRSAAVGRGRVLLVVGSEDLASDRVGHCMALPSASERTRLATACRLFGEWSGASPPERRTYDP